MSSSSSSSSPARRSARPGTLTLGGLALRQLRSNAGSYLPTAVGVAAALGLAVAVTLTQARTEDANLAQTVNGLGPQGLVAVRLTGVHQPSDYQKFQADVQRAVQAQQGLVTARSARLYAGPFTPRTINGEPVGSLGAAYATTVTPLQIAVQEDLASNVQLAAGAWPSSPTSGDTIEVTLPENAATAAFLKLGDTQCQRVINPFTYTVCIHVAGIWRPRDPKAAYWGQEQAPLVAAYTDDATYFKVINAEATTDVFPQLASVAVVTLSPDVNAIRAAGPDASLVQLRRLHADFGVARPDAVVVSSLEPALDHYVTESTVAAFAVQLVAVQLLLIALYCVWFLAGALLVQRRELIAVWRSRGWSWSGVSRLLFFELLLVAVVATPVGIAAGWEASELTARYEYGAQAIPPFHFDLLKIGAPIVAVVIVVLALLAGQAVLAAHHGVLRTRSEASRPALPWWRRRFIDLALAIVAIPLLVEVSFLGSASVRAAGSVSNPMTLILPGLAIALLALAALRLLPLAAAVIARVPRSTSAKLASIQLRRAPGQHAGLAILLMVAVALGIFASAYASTSSRNQADRAAYRVGADARATFTGALTQLPDGIALEGALSRTNALRGDARTAGEDLQMLAVDPYTFAPVAYTRSDLASTPLPELVQLLADRETGGLLLPEGTSTVSIWVHGSNTGGQLSMHLSDAHGRPVTVDLGSLAFSGWKQLTASFPAAGQFRFRDFAVAGVSTAGDVAFSGFAAGNTSVDSFAEALPPFADTRLLDALWWRTDWDTGSKAQVLNPSYDVSRNNERSIHFRVVPAHIPTYVRPPVASPDLKMFQPPPGATPDPNAPPPIINSFPQVPPAGALPAIVSSGVATRFGLTVGKSMQLDVEHVGVSATIIGVAEHFPSVYPEVGDFVILPLDPLLIQIANGGHQRPWPNEIWARSTPGGMDSLVASMHNAPGVVEVFDQRAFAAAAARNPHQLELQSNLVLGFVASVALGLLALVLHFLVLGRGRLTEYAVLEANGMPQGLVRRSLIAEEVLLVLFCIASGALLGLVASVAVLPGLQLSGSPFDTVPQTIITFDASLLTAVLGAVLALSLLASLAISTAVERPRIMTELRALG